MGLEALELPDQAMAQLLLGRFTEETEHVTPAI